MSGSHGCGTPCPEVVLRFPGPVPSGRRMRSL